MTGSFDRNGRLGAARVAVLGQMLVVAGTLSACSSFADQANPLNWFGDDSAPAANEAGSRPAGGVLPKSTPEGLPADTSNGHYAPPVRREVAPTRPLVRQTAPETPAVAVASVPAAAPAPAPVKTADLPAAAPTQPAAVVAAAPAPAPVAVAPAPVAAAAPAPTFAQAQARAAEGPDAPPASVQMAPPPPADIPDTVPVPGRPRRLQAQYEQRLAESAQQVVRPGVVAPASVAGRGGVDDTPIHLIDPASRPARDVAARGGAGKALMAPPAQPAASFQVAAIDFGGGARLSSADLGAIADVARLYRQTPGAVIRVIGHAPAPVVGGADSVGRLMGGLDASQARANAVAAELHRRGVPAAKILVAADPGAGHQGGAQVFLDVM